MLRNEALVSRNGNPEETGWLVTPGGKDPPAIGQDGPDSLRYMREGRERGVNIKKRIKSTRNIYLT